MINMGWAFIMILICICAIAAAACILLFSSAWWARRALQKHRRKRVEAIQWLRSTSGRDAYHEFKQGDRK